MTFLVVEVQILFPALKTGFAAHAAKPFLLGVYVHSSPFSQERLTRSVRLTIIALMGLRQPDAGCGCRDNTQKNNDPLNCWF